MTQSKRIILNILATYGRQAVAMICGLFSTRWILMALGQESYGLFGLVGSLVLFVSFINSEFSAALTRFYAIAIGASRKTPEIGLLECRSWFTAGIMIHVLLPVVLVSLGYPLGIWAIKCGLLNIPGERLCDCVWLWRFVMITTYVSVLTVPFNAMFVAKQEIAELTAYSLIQTSIKTAFSYYMTTVSRDWLVAYGGVACLCATLPACVITVRASLIFKECRVIRSAMRDASRVWQITHFALWRVANGISRLARHQCQEIIINRRFGVDVNAAYTVGTTMAAESAVLTAGLSGAFVPAITSAYGAGDMRTMREMAFRASKFGVMLTLFLAVPLLLESKEVLFLWLQNPPPFSQGIFCWVVISVIIEEFSIGHYNAINASGEIGRFYLVRSSIGIVALFVPLLLLLLKESPYMVAMGIAVTSCFILMVDLYYARKLAGMGISRLLKSIMCPIVLSSAAAMLVGAVVCLQSEPSLIRVVETTILVDLSQLALFWLIVLDDNERRWVLNHLHRVSLSLYGRKDADE